MPGIYPELIRVYPSQDDSPILTLEPQITLYWSEGMKSEQFSDPARLVTYISLINLSTGQDIPLSFVSYTASERKVILEPTAELNSSTTYQLLVKKGLRDINGRAHQIDRTWSFVTSDSEILQPVLLSPSDYSVSPYVPTFEWEDTGFDNQIQISQHPTFNSLIADETISELEYYPSAVFDLDQTYYWRVRAVSGALEGDWSSTRSFYLSSTAVAHPTTSSQPQPFFLEEASIDIDNSNLGSWPSIYFDFSGSLHYSTSGTASVTKIPVLPRNDDPTSFTETAVSGSWSIDDDVLSFTPSEDISSNYRYKFTVKPKDNLGNSLPIITKYITGSYTPYYTDLLSVKAMLAREANMHPDDLINWTIHKCSLEANAIYSSYLGGVMVIGVEGILETQVRAPALQSHAVMRWVTAVSAVAILKRALNDELRNLGRKQKLSDYEQSLDKDFLTGIQEAIKYAQEEADKWDTELIGSNPVLSASPHSKWSYSNWWYDSYVGHLTWDTNF